MDFQNSLNSTSLVHYRLRRRRDKGAALVTALAIVRQRRGGPRPGGRANSQRLPMPDGEWQRYPGTRPWSSLAPTLAGTTTGVPPLGFKYSTFDALIGFHISLRRENAVFPYFYQRWDAGSTHHEFYGRAGGRNTVLCDYLSNLGKL